LNRVDACIFVFYSDIASIINQIDVITGATMHGVYSSTTIKSIISRSTSKNVMA
jgi:hypothetical protein